MKVDEITDSIIGAAIEVHRELGPGLLEGVYQKCMARELELRHIGFEVEVTIDAVYKGTKVPNAFRMDILVMDKVVVELKTVEKILQVHSAQLLSYLKLSGKQIGLLINFNVPVLSQGIKRVVNKL